MNGLGKFHTWGMTKLGALSRVRLKRATQWLPKWLGYEPRLIEVTSLHNVAHREVSVRLCWGQSKSTGPHGRCNKNLQVLNDVPGSKRDVRGEREVARRDQCLLQGAGF